MNQNHIYIDECPLCRQGTLIPVRDRDSDRYLLICDDCESQWQDPEAALQGGAPLSQEAKHLEEISIEELEKIGWKKYIKKPFI